MAVDEEEQGQKATRCYQGTTLKASPDAVLETQSQG